MLVLAFSTSLCAADGKIIYTKSFPGSAPPFTQIVIAPDGSGEYREDAKDDDPVKFQLNPSDTSNILGIAEHLNHFAKPLESHLKVANMGIKTFRWEGSDGSRETKFNYSEDPDAKTLADLFEQIAESQRAYMNLDRAVHFDRLGAQEAVLRVETLHDQKRLLPETEFLDLLDRVANNESFLHMARERAANLADAIRKPK